MTHRSPFGRLRWHVPIVLPAVLAVLLVAALAVESLRSSRVHRRMVQSALSDYTSFATWQFTRRASDYLRLVITANLPWGLKGDAVAGCRIGPTSPPCLTTLALSGAVSCALESGRVRVVHNETSMPSDAIARVLDSVARGATRQSVRTGLAEIGAAPAPTFVAYWFGSDTTGRWISCDARVVEAAALDPIFQHVARFAPLLPPSFVGRLPNDSLVALRVETASHAHVSAFGAGSSGLIATDVLGPDLAGLRVTVTLHPAAVERLIAGGMPASNAVALIGALIVTLALCVIAVLQLRRSQEIVRLRGNFIASVSHELKTPLAQISLFADTLAARDRPPAERARYLGIIGREAKRLGNLVDSILHFASMRGAGNDIATEPSVLAEEIRAAVEAFAPIAAGKNVAIELTLDETIEAPLDQHAFRQVMNNVLDNALKYGPEGQRINITALRDGSSARIWIDDQGPGVIAEDRERLFEPFVRAARQPHVAGSGIGLAVVRDIVHGHRGTVAMLASPAGGVRLEIVMPCGAV